jgi:hypothetical protein
MYWWSTLIDLYINSIALPCQWFHDGTSLIGYIYY